MTDAERNFDWAIAPVTAADFFAGHFEKTHLVIRRDDPDYYTGLLSPDDIDRVVTGSGLWTQDLQMVRVGSPIAVGDYAFANGAIDPVRVFAQFAQGGTIVLPHLHRLLPRLAAFCRALEHAFSADLQTNIYLTPANAQGFKTHYDSHDVLVLQVTGSKTWRIYDTPVPLPLRSQAFDPEGFEPGPISDTFVLGPGDMAYVPRGLVHDAIATDEVSLHITTGILTRKWVDLVLEAVAAHALADPALRASLPPGHAAPGFDPAPMLATFRGLLDQTLAAVDPAATLAGFADSYRAGRMPVVPGQFAQVRALADAGADSIAGVRPHLIHHLRQDDDTVHLECYGNDISFPAHAAEALAHAISHDRYRIGDLPGDLDDAGKVVLVRRLVREGVVTLHG